MLHFFSANIFMNKNIFFFFFKYLESEKKYSHSFCILPGSEHGFTNNEKEKKVRSKRAKYSLLSIPLSQKTPPKTTFSWFNAI